MTQIKKILDKQGNEVFIRTSTKAVVDENGYTAESRLQAMQDEINQAQLEAGAVPSDLTPTDGSTNWVTSGGVYNQLNVGNANVEFDLTGYTAVRAFPSMSGASEGTWVCTSSNYPYYGYFIPIVADKKYAITSNENGCRYAFLKNNTYSHGTAVAYATGETRVDMEGNTTVVDVAPSDATYLYVSQQWSNDYTPQSILEINKIPIKDVLEDVDTEPAKDSSKLITSGGVYNTITVNKTNAVDLVMFDSVKAYIGTNNKWTNIPTADSNACVFVPVNENCSTLHIKANESYTSFFAFLTSTSHAGGQTPSYSSGETGRHSVAADSSVDIAIPDGTLYIYIATSTASYGIIPQDVKITGTRQISSIVNDLLYAVKDIYPEFTHGYISYTTGDFDNTTGVGLKSLATPRFIKISKSFNITPEVDCYIRVFFYDDNYTFLSYVNVDATANTPYVINGDTFTFSFVKIMIFNESSHTTIPPLQKLKLTGPFYDDWDIFNVRPTDSGYHSIKVFVNVTNPTCCDSVTDSVQDSEELLPDYGVICLPTQYRNTGEATRLIIYCHGAAVNYADNVTRFNTQDLEPEYWLAEGYAVMDIEGNPFDNTNEHCSMPQAMDSYAAGYKWAIEHYNLKRDGVFLGGRSMGGGCAIMLMRRQCPIPVIANCPNSPALTMPLGSTAVRKTFYATHCGFTLPSGFSFSNGFVTSEKQVWLDNWDKWIKHIALFTTVTDLPTTDEEKSIFIDAMFTGSESRINLYKVMHATAKCPVKIFGCNQDETCPPETTSGLFYRMLINSGQLSELRLFDSNKDYSGTGTSAHHYDTQDPALRTTVTTRYGEVMTNVPVVYVEMLQFWRRYEQGN